MKIAIFTDGAARGNPGPGGYGVVLLSDAGHHKELSGGFRNTTNNRMELLAVIKGLEALKNPSTVTVFSDSKYVVDAVTKGWLDNWRRKGFAGKKNPDLWRRYLEVSRPHRITFEWVKGHAGNKYNERCDQLAVEASKKPDLPPDLGYEKEVGKLL